MRDFTRHKAGAQITGKLSVAIRNMKQIVLAVTSTWQSSGKNSKSQEDFHENVLNNCCVESTLNWQFYHSCVKRTTREHDLREKLDRNPNCWVLMANYVCICVGLLKKLFPIFFHSIND